MTSFDLASTTGWPEMSKPTTRLWRPGRENQSAGDPPPRSRRSTVFAAPSGTACDTLPQAAPPPTACQKPVPITWRSPVPDHGNSQRPGVAGKLFGIAYTPLSRASITCHPLLAFRRAALAAPLGLGPRLVSAPVAMTTACTERVCQSQYAYREPSGATQERGTGIHLATARSKLKPYDVSLFTALLGSAVNAASGKVRKPPLPNWPLDIGSLQERVLASGTGLALGLESGIADGSGVGVV